jgi:hypothetical protein
MNNRRAILSLIAMGRITPREAERLLAVSSDCDEIVVAGALLLVIAWILFPPAHAIVAGVSQMFDTLAPSVFGVGHHAARLFSNEFGGML